MPDISAYTLGQTLNASVFEKGEHVDVEGNTKGRGFAGIIKRHGFKGGHASHGPTMGREPGSIGSSAYPSRVIKGKRLPGRMGGKPLTTKNLMVAGVDTEQNVVLVRGAIPGPTNGLVFILKRS
jgi:large subunit ribosomal protein L3